MQTGISGKIFEDLVFYLAQPVLIVGAIVWIFNRIYKLGTLNEQFNNLTNLVKDLNKGFERLDKTVSNITTYLAVALGADKNLFGSQSPLKLTKEGRKLLKATGFIDIYKDQKDYFLNKIRKNNPQTEAEVDESATQIMNGYDDKKHLSKFKQVAYENGVVLPTVLKLLAIYLREQAIKELKVNQQTKSSK